MRIIGLTGGIATGKSMVSEYLASQGITVIDADKIARQIVGPGSATLQRLVDEFGPEILTSTGELNRKRLGEIVFGDKAKLTRLNELTHPVIHQVIEAQIAEAEGKVPVLVVDAALLLEAGWENLVHETWVVYAKPEQQLKRLMARDGMTEVQAKERIKSQMPVNQKLRYADVIIDNTDTIAKAQQQVDLALALQN